MATPIVFGGVTYNIPDPGEDDWGSELTSFFIAISTTALTRDGGQFNLLNELDFGPNFGLKTIYVKSRAANPATSGVIRLGNNEVISWRNSDNSGNIPIRINADNKLQVGSNVVEAAHPGSDNTVLGSNSGATSWVQVNNARVANDAAIAYSKLNLSNSIRNADVLTTAAIARSKLASGSNNHVVINDGSGNFSSEATLDKIRGGTGQDNSNVTFPSTGTLVTRDASETLTEKTLTSPVVNTSLTGTAVEGDLSVSASATKVPSAEAAKDYVDNQIASIAVGAAPVGAMFPYFGLTAPTSWLLADGRTIGNAASGATSLASATAQALFTHLWDNSDNTTLPIQDSSGSPTTRGASAADDWAANKRMPLVDMRGRVGIGLDNMGGTSANRVTAAFADELGGVGGNENLQEHNHSIDHNHAAVTSANQSVGHTHSIAHNHAAVTSGNQSASHSHAQNKFTSGSFNGPDPGDGYSTGASSAGLSTGNQSASHTHSVDLPNFTGNSGGISANHTHSVDLPNFTGNSGNSGAGDSQNIQPSIALAFIIKL